MLLLVLILVVIAFGLLVVALLTGSVLWAWVSVGVSVVAAVVLLIDWLQRRSAINAGAAAPAETPSRPMPMADLDPATEILPVVPPSGRGSPDAGSSPVDRTERVPDAQQTVAIGAVRPSGSSAGPSGAEAPVTSSGVVSSPSVTKSGDDVSSPVAGAEDADEVTRSTSRSPAAAGDTVSISADPTSPESVPDTTSAEQTGSTGTGRPAMSLSKDSGSPSGPGGPPATADADVPDGLDDDRTVVSRPRSVMASEPAGHGGATESPAGSGSAAERTIVSALPAITPSGSRSEPSGPSGASPSAEPSRHSADEVGTDEVAAVEQHVAAGSTADAGNDASEHVSSALHTSADSGDVAGTAGADATRPSASTDDVEKTVTVAARQPSVPSGDPGRGPDRPTTSDTSPAESPTPPASPVDGAPPVHGAGSFVPAGAASEQAPPVEEPIRAGSQAGVDIFGSSSVPAAAGEGFGSGAAPEPPPGPLGEAPEEPYDPAVAETVSGLEDEVVVVDEEPRYHVGECRALTSTAVIPLPVREAVELGFTPCGWCSPNRTVADRHRTAAR